MVPSPPLKHYPNLPVSQRDTQCVVDRFNEDEARWHRRILEPIAALLANFRSPDKENGGMENESKN